MTSPKEIMDLERKFWQSLVDGDIEVAVALLDEVSTTVGPQGIARFSPADYRTMAGSGDSRLESFEFSDEDVVFSTPDVAVASYKARQCFTVKGKRHEMVVYDTTTWVRKGGRWVASAHTESPA